MEKLFEQICNLSISSSWLIVAVFAVRFLFRKSSKKYICALWLLVGIRLVFPFSVESALSLVPEITVAAIEELTEEKNLPAEPEEEPVQPVVGEGFNPYDYDTGGVYFSTGETEKETEPELAEPEVVKTFSVRTILPHIWAAGVLGMLCYFVGSFWLLKRKLSAAVIFRENVWQSEYVDSPFILGLINPRIYIPYHLTEDHLKYVLAHEKVHQKRWDHWTKVIAFFILSVYWFHPLVWLSYKYLCKDIEMACDEQVAERLNEEERKEYSKALLSCHGKKTWYHACPVGFGEVNVKERVIRVLNYRKPSFWIVSAVLILSVVLAVCFMTNAEKLEELSEEVIAEEPAEVPIYGKVSLGDLNYNGREEYYTYDAVEDEGYHGQMIFYMDEEPIYTYNSQYQITGVSVEYADVDGDYRKELFVTWIPPERAGSLMEYFVLDKTADGWRSLEMPHGETVHENAFPISMVYGAQEGILEISCEGSDALLFFDLKEHYETAAAKCEEGSEAQKLYQEILNGTNHEPGQSFGGISGNSLYSVRRGTYRQESSPGSEFYDDYPCMIASHRLEGIGGTEDYLGNLHIYYQYDENGKVDIWNLKLGNNEMKTLNPDYYFMSLPEADLTVYYDEKENNSCKGIYLKKGHDGTENIVYFPWEYQDAFSYSSELTLLPNGQHCLFEFTEDFGEQVHMVDLATMKEIPVQSPEEVIGAYFKTEEMNLETGEVRFVCQGKRFVEMAEPEYMDEIMYREFLQADRFQYELEGDTLIYRSYLAAGYSYYIGELRISYVYRNGEYQMDSLTYQSFEDYFMPDTVSRDENEVRMAAYQKAIWILRDEYLLPNGEGIHMLYSSYFWEKDGYHMRDIDNDGRIELIINCPNYLFYIFEYDPDTRQYHEQLGVRASASIYQDGTIVAFAWPYEIYQYRKATDTYEFVERMEAEEYELWKENEMKHVELMNIRYERLATY